MDNREFTLDYGCTDCMGIGCVDEAWMMDVVDMVYSDHAAVSVSIEWKV